MSLWALVNVNVVITTTEQDDQPQLPEFTAINIDSQPQVCVGWTWDGTNFYAPVIPSTWFITNLALKRRWPQAKWLAMLTSADPVILDLKDSLTLANYVNLNDLGLNQAIAYLQGTTIPVSYQLTSTEANAILTTPAQPYEIPPGFPGYDPTALAPLPSINAAGS